MGPDFNKHEHLLLKRSKNKSGNIPRFPTYINMCYITENYYLWYSDSPVNSLWWWKNVFHWTLQKRYLPQIPNPNHTQTDFKRGEKVDLNGEIECHRI